MKQTEKDIVGEYRLDTPNKQGAVMSGEEPGKYKYLL